MNKDQWDISPDRPCGCESACDCWKYGERLVVTDDTDEYFGLRGEFIALHSLGLDRVVLRMDRCRWEVGFWPSDLKREAQTESSR